MNITRTFLGKAVIISLLGIVMAFGFAITAFAVQSPPGCSADNSVVNIASDITTAVEGDTITFSVSAGNPASADGCDITGRSMTLTLPDGTPTVFGPFNYPNPTVVAFVGSAPYVADNTDAVGGFWTANVSWNGTLKSAVDLPSSGSKNASVVQVMPLTIEKTADTSFDREWDWTIEKTGSDDELILSEGQTHTVSYEVDVDATSTDTNRVINGTVTITNPANNPDVEVQSVTDELDAFGSVTLVCDQDAPVTLSGGESINCTYSQAVVNDDDTENEVTVTTNGPVPGGSNTAPVNWSGPDSEIDECIDVNDTVGGFLGTVCADEAPETFSYDVTFGPEDGEDVDVVLVCDDDINYPNTADFETNDTATIGDDEWNVHVVVNCFQGCTLTQGYWKTHSQEGKAPYDDGWQEVGVLEEDTLFFNSGKTWYELFHTPPKGGNAYIQLAHQYMAAKLNILNGASETPAVTSAITGAEALFNAQGAGDMTLTKPETSTARGYAGTLGSFNEGSIGPGHCDEQNPI